MAASRILFIFLWHMSLLIDTSVVIIVKMSKSKLWVHGLHFLIALYFLLTTALIYFIHIFFRFW